MLEQDLKSLRLRPFFTWAGDGQVRVPLPPSPPLGDLDPLRAAMGAEGTTVSMADRYDQGGRYGALCACVSQALHAHSHLATAYGGINTFWET